MAGNFAGRDNSGNQFQADEINYYEAAPVPSLIPHQLAETPESPSAAPNSTAREIALEVGWSWANLVYEASPGRWRYAESYDNEPKRVLVAWFTNPLPEKGNPVERGLRVLAHIELKSPKEGSTQQIPAAYWLYEMGHQVNLGAGKNLGLLLGHIEYKRFYSYINPYPSDGLNSEFDVPLRQIGEKKSVPVFNHILLRVSIIKVDTEESVIEKVIFDMTRAEQGGWILQIK
jgi:hypothetical protein